MRREKKKEEEGENLFNRLRFFVSTCLKARQSRFSFNNKRKKDFLFQYTTNWKLRSLIITTMQKKKICLNGCKFVNASLFISFIFNMIIEKKKCAIGNVRVVSRGIIDVLISFFVYPNWS